MSESSSRIAPHRAPRIVIAGGVESTRRTLRRLLAHGVKVVGVLGLDSQAEGRTSGFARLDDLARQADVPYRSFVGINEVPTVEAVRDWRPDLLFAVGLSQLLGPELLSVPALASIGFHPTRLPEGRGRAPVAWLTLEGRSGAATFFVIDGGVDSGPILVQEPFEVAPGDDAGDVSRKLYDAMDRALDCWLPQLLAGKWDPVPQDELKASYYGRRGPEDGCIDWSRPSDEIAALVRASSRPHPGAYTYVNGVKLLIWRAQSERELPWKGVTGRVLHHDPRQGWLVQAGAGLLWLTEVESESEPPLRVGWRLGFAPQDEVYRLRQQLAQMEKRLAELEKATAAR